MTDDKIDWVYLFCGLGCIIMFALGWVAEEIIPSAIMLGSGCCFLGVCIGNELKKAEKEDKEPSECEDSQEWEELFTKNP